MKGIQWVDTAFKANMLLRDVNGMNKYKAMQCLTRGLHIAGGIPYSLK